MPAQPAWFHRLAEIMEELRELQVSHLDRHAIERLFQVGQRRARQLMAGLPGFQAGNACAIERQALLARLEAIASGDRCQTEISRRARVADELHRTRRLLAARRVTLPPSPAPPLPNLAATIDLRPGELRITFRSAQELALRLFELSQSMTADWDAFAASVEP